MFKKQFYRLLCPHNKTLSFPGKKLIERSIKLKEKDVNPEEKNHHQISQASKTATIGISQLANKFLK